MLTLSLSFTLLESVWGKLTLELTIGLFEIPGVDLVRSLLSVKFCNRCVLRDRLTCVNVLQKSIEHFLLLLFLLQGLLLLRSLPSLLV